jgi:hypothetical protein
MLLKRDDIEILQAARRILAHFQAAALRNLDTKRVEDLGNGIKAVRSLIDDFGENKT